MRGCCWAKMSVLQMAGGNACGTGSGSVGGDGACGYMMVLKEKADKYSRALYVVLCTRPTVAAGFILFCCDFFGVFVWFRPFLTISGFKRGVRITKVSVVGAPAVY